MVWGDKTQVIEEPIFVVTVVVKGVLEIVEGFHTKGKALSRHLTLGIKYENNVDAEVSFWQPSWDASEGMMQKNLSFPR